MKPYLFLTLLSVTTLQHEPTKQITRVSQTCLVPSYLYIFFVFTYISFVAIPSIKQKPLSYPHLPKLSPPNKTNSNPTSLMQSFSCIPIWNDFPLLWTLGSFTGPFTYIILHYSFYFPVPIINCIVSSLRRQWLYLITSGPLFYIKILNKDLLSWTWS